MKKSKKFFLTALSILIAGYIIGYCVTSLTKAETIVWNAAFLTDTMTFAIAGGLLVIVMIAKLSKLDTDSYSSTKNKAFTDEGKEVKQFYSTKWISLKELKTNPKFMFNYYSGLRKQTKDGIPIRAELIRGKTEINMIKPIHTIVIGTTGSGKTTMVVDPTIQILSETKSKPSMVISDPKGELHSHNSEKLKASGYDVQVVDLREPDKSARWNPIERAFDAFQRAHNLHKEVKKHTGDPKQLKLLTIPNANYSDFWYEFDGIAYDNIEVLKKDLDATKDKLINIANEDILDISETLCPIQGQDPSWSRGAQGFIQAILLAMLEDSLVPELGMTKERYNFYNLYKISGVRDDGQDNVLTLKNYFQGRPKISPTKELAATVVNNHGATSKGYLGHVTGALKTFADSGVCYLTSGTDIDFSKFADKPTALFIIIPDEKNTRHTIANIFISQLYKILIERANKAAKERGGEPELPRNVYFLLDEFGNLPKIEKMKSFITAGRSRRIFLMLVIQDYTQLVSIYGEQDAATIRNNCNIHMFIGTKDAKTREDFSKNCGNIAITVTNKNESTSSNKDNYYQGQVSTSTSSQTQQRPLISPDELDHLPPFHVVVSIFGDFAAKTVFTPTYKNPTYSMKRPPLNYTPSKFLDQDEVYYDIEKRNSIILKDNDDDDDDDFDFSKFTGNN